MESLQIEKMLSSEEMEEAYKAVRTNIQFMGNKVKVIAITSCEPGEGKSTISFSLAESLAQTGKRILYMDADLRCSTFGRHIKGKHSGKGLSHYLSGQGEMDEILYAADREHLFVMTTGPVPPNPVELFNHRRFKFLIETMRQGFDYIIIDTPPLGSVIDSAVIAPVCDGIIMVIDSGRIDGRFARIVKKQIVRTGCPFLGVILNKVQILHK